jgi:uncharacterized protein YdeI (YjbR/CyaY-like superfamily)
MFQSDEGFAPHILSKYRAWHTHTHTQHLELRMCLHAWLSQYAYLVASSRVFVVQSVQSSVCASVYSTNGVQVAIVSTWRNYADPAW